MFLFKVAKSIAYEPPIMKININEFDDVYYARTEKSRKQCSDNIAFI